MIGNWRETKALLQKNACRVRASGDPGAGLGCRSPTPRAGRPQAQPPRAGARALHTSPCVYSRICTRLAFVRIRGLHGRVWAVARVRLTGCAAKEPSRNRSKILARFMSLIGRAHILQLLARFEACKDHWTVQLQR